MTTIAYKHEDREIAYDSRTSIGDIIHTDKANKKLEVNGVSFFTAGKPCDYNLMIDGYFGKKLEEVPECTMIAVDGNDVILVTSSNDACICKAVMSDSFAIGSGDFFATSAMDFGKSAEGAVEYAKTRDPFSGGKVNVFKVGE